MGSPKDFWHRVDIRELSDRWSYKEKVAYEIYALIPHLFNSMVIWDAACGDGRVSEALTHVFPNKQIISTDLNPKYIFATTWDLEEGIPNFTFDTVLLFGVIQYLSDENLEKFFGLCNAKRVIIRTPVDKDVKVDGSEDLGADYKAYYRSLENITRLLKPTHEVKIAQRIYPNHLDTKYNVQTFMVADPCE